MNVRIALIFICFIGGFSFTAAGTEPTVEELIGLAPTLTCSDAKSFEIEGLFTQDDVSFSFRVFFRSKDQYSVMIGDATDGTPLLFLSNGKALSYDPITPHVLVGENVHGFFNLKVDEGDFKFGPGVKNGAVPEMTIDLRSFFDGHSKQSTHAKTGEKQYRLSTTSEHGNTVVATIDMSRPCPYTRVEFIRKDTKKPFLLLTKISQDVQEDNIAFPAIEKLSDKVKVKKWTSEDELDMAEGLFLITRALLVRLICRSPDAPEASKVSLLFAVDWEKVKENDQSYSQELRKLFASRELIQKAEPSSR